MNRIGYEISIKALWTGNSLLPYIRSYHLDNSIKKYL
jgi:hypothetical protein